MELSKTSFDVDLDEVDTDIPWLKSVPTADIANHRLRKQPGQSEHICDSCQKSFKRKHNLVVHFRVHKGYGLLKGRSGPKQNLRRKCVLFAYI